MSAFDDWFAEQVKDLGNDKRFRNRKGMKEAFNAGMEMAIQIIEEGDKGLPRTWEDDIAAIRKEAGK